MEEDGSLKSGDSVDTVFFLGSVGVGFSRCECVDVGTVFGGVGRGKGI